jgi:hypothetical protein
LNGSFQCRFCKGTRWQRCSSCQGTGGKSSGQ